MRAATCALAPLEIAIGRRGATLARLEPVVVHRQAHRAARFAPLEAGTGEDLVETFAFGLAVTVIPISEGLNTPKKLFHAPIAVLRGMVRLFFALMIIEFLALLALYV